MKVKYPHLLKFILGIIQTTLVIVCYNHYKEWNPVVTIVGLAIVIAKIEEIKNDLVKKINNAHN